jgi:F-type H+-transporting ATPase subunit b
MDPFFSTLIPMIDSFLFLAAGATDESLIGQFGIDWKIIIAQAINFLIVAVLLYKFAFKPVLSTMEERQTKISDGLQYAEEMKSKLAESERQQAEALKNANAEAQKIVIESRTQAKTLYEKQVSDAANKTEDMLKRAEATIEQEREKMLADVRKEVAGLVVQTAGKVLQKELDEAERNRLSEAAAKELYGS